MPLAHLDLEYCSKIISRFLVVPGDHGIIAFFVKSPCMGKKAAMYLLIFWQHLAVQQSGRLIRTADAPDQPYFNSALAVLVWADEGPQVPSAEHF